jgi:hypothetical protein
MHHPGPVRRLTLGNQLLPTAPSSPQQGQNDRSHPIGPDQQKAHQHPPNNRGRIRDHHNPEVNLETDAKIQGEKQRLHRESKQDLPEITHLRLLQKEHELHPQQGMQPHERLPRLPDQTGKPVPAVQQETGRHRGVLRLLITALLCPPIYIN